MATEPKQSKPEEDDAPERRTREEEAPRRPSKADEAREDGMPGYGQPDEEVREQSLPDQQW